MQNKLIDFVAGVVPDLISSQ